MTRLPVLIFLLLCYLQSKAQQQIAYLEAPSLYYRSISAVKKINDDYFVICTTLNDTNLIDFKNDELYRIDPLENNFNEVKILDSSLNRKIYFDEGQTDRILILSSDSACGDTRFHIAHINSRGLLETDTLLFVLPSLDIPEISSVQFKDNAIFIATFPCEKLLSNQVGITRFDLTTDTYNYIETDSSSLSLRVQILNGYGDSLNIIQGGKLLNINFQSGMISEKVLQTFAIEDFAIERHRSFNFILQGNRIRKDQNQPYFVNGLLISKVFGDQVVSTSNLGHDSTSNNVFSYLNTLKFSNNKIYIAASFSEDPMYQLSLHKSEVKLGVRLFELDTNLRILNKWDYLNEGYHYVRGAEVIDNTTLIFGTSYTFDDGLFPFILELDDQKKINSSKSLSTSTSPLLYPNPGTKMFIAKAKGWKTESITNISGEEVKFISDGEYIALVRPDKGLYFVHLRNTEGENRTVKWIAY